ncbi:diaminopimelate epimerase [Stakelama saccharophila]|uniref:Diaminopimelate epimerase n=1 Tax=Stakelama saccharophila TaxID=3075605 RepID=A0ABZ0B8D4_9SPHN|nr:diaminopimelate epimerase [Stakelama sp. W311]WNO53554.1 diaminopimelate epimerase [Stakelama sp. W311]
MRLAFIKCHGSGNDFPLVDAREIALDDAGWARVARALANRDGPVGGDGLLLLTPGGDGHAFGMRMFNPDGSEAETCLNGLRCTARLGFETTGLNAAQVRLKTSSAQAAMAEPIAPGVTSITTRAGPVTTDPGAVGLVGLAEAVIDAAIAGLPSERAFTALAIANPHLVAFVETVDEAELVALGDWCEAKPALIPNRINVSFASAGSGGLFVRTYERGVGLTNSCGSAMAAATFAAGLTGRIAFGREIVVRNRGGLVRARAEAPAAGGMVSVTGNATFLYDGVITVDPDSGAIDDLAVHSRRPDEVAAWAAVAGGA